MKVFFCIVCQREKGKNEGERENGGNGYGDWGQWQLVSIGSDRVSVQVKVRGKWDQSLMDLQVKLLGFCGLEMFDLLLQCIGYG